MSVPTVNNFLYCVSLKTATTFGGMSCSFLDKAVSCLIHHSHAWTTNDKSSIMLIFIYVIMSIAFITTILMIVGSAKSKHKLMQPFLVFNIIDFHMTTLTICYGIYKLFGDSTDFGIMASITGALAIIFAAYYWVVVYSRYSEIYVEPGDDNALLDDFDV